MGVQTVGEVEERHYARVSRGLCALHHGQETCHVRPLQPRPEGKDATDRLSSSSGQGDNYLFYSPIFTARN